MSKILIIGDGYLGKQYSKYFNSEISNYYIKNEQDVSIILNAYQPKIVINAAGITGKPNIDWCEDHKEETLSGNVLLPLWIAKTCDLYKIKMIHLSSGCIYSGNNNGKGHSEEDLPNFTGSFYSQTKFISESLIKEYNPLQLRLRMPISNIPNERDFITKITQYDKVINVENSITIVEDLMKATEALIYHEATGIFNLTNTGSITHNKILQLYKEIVDPHFIWENFTIEEMNDITKAQRSNCVLDNTKLLQYYKMPNIEDSLKKVLDYRRTL